VSDTTALAALTRSQREGFVDTLAGLSDDQWLAPSLCAEWRVVDVAAHLAWAPVLGPVAGAVAMVRYGFSMNRMIARSAVEWSARGREAILDQLRSNARTGVTPIGMPPVAGLADAVVHGLDVRRPLGLPGQVPPESLAPLADFTLGTPWPMNAVVGGSARRRVAGVRLVAADVRGSAEELLLLLYGRHVARGAIVGDGVPLLASRLGGAWTA
jgi:uncharacterized protein (TIGR03083 family)